jgi:CBS domain containing-hemolysin-like protein
VTLGFLPELAHLNDAMRQFVARREHLAVVVDEFAAVVGVATLEDLIETILGVEIVDETDHTTDMRALAMKLRDERLTKLGASIGT